MGSASSKFKKYLQHGDEYAAMQVFQSSPELRKNLDPNLSYGDNHHHNTALHYAAKHGMKHLLRTFLNDLGGNPNKKNASNETSLHVACQLEQQKSLSAQERRAACVTLLLQWRGVFLPSGDREKVDQLSQDQRGNSALHCAAQSGLQRCVELLVAGGSPLFAENNDRLTPCDLAMQSGHHDIAQFLETKMVFADNNDTVNEAEIGRGGVRESSSETGEEGQAGEEDDEEEEVYSGLKTQDLQEAKDQLLVETADMLHIPLFTAEALLRDNEWSREALLEKWMKEPVLCCQLAGVQPPASALQHSALTPAHDEAALGSPQPAPSPARQRAPMPIPSSAEVFCEICASIVPVWDDPPVQMSCEHRFCSSCWERYLTVKIQDGDAHHILCPAFECPILVPVEVIEKLVSPEMARRYLQFDIKAFVETNRSIKWCPMPGCGRAVRLPPDQPVRESSSHGQPPLGPANTSHAVDCGNGHFFCWECLGDAHAPCGCAQWQEWQRKIAEVRPEELRTSCAESEDAANCLWLVTNSKPCPNCKSPIQKNEGCNHMKCSKCKFDFCWVCLESWKKHSSATGGYFRCNRFEVVTRVDEKQGALLSEASQRNRQLQELTRFLHYYTRFRNHENSQRLESPLLGAVHHKMELLAASLCRTQPKSESGSAQQQSAQKGTKFIEDGVRELLKARRVLCGSYVYGYYLEDNGYNKTIFEFMQNELEEVTEKLSEMVARPYLRTPRPVIMQTTALARRKRHEFVRAVDKGLVPPETPPALRKEHMAQALAASLKGMDPVKGWVRDGQSAPSLAALYDWPQYESDEEESEVTQALAVSLVGECSRVGCRRPRARNPRTGSVHEYCSLRCSRASRLGSLGYHDADMLTMAADMDLVIALEMSRLQMIEDEVKKQQREQKISSSSNAGTSVVHQINPSISTAQEGDDQQLKLAIQLSLQESVLQGTPLLPPVCSACDTTALSSSLPLMSMASSLQRPSTVDLTVDYFLKSLACRDLQSFESSTTDQDWESNKLSQDSQSSAICFQTHTTSEVEDGRFEIGELHENGGRFAGDQDDTENNKMMRRSHSTGDLCTRPTVVPMCSYFDSDHSQHEDKPEELARRNLRQVASAEDDRSSGLDGSPCVVLNYGGQSSIEDTSDSLNADLEVCGILGTTDDDSSEQKEDPIPLPPKPKQKIAANESVDCNKVSNTPTCSTTTIVTSSSGRNSNSTGPNSSLRIRICKSPKLDTDSSNEYESETGIPKSPTLFISGVSISRTPEPRSPAMVALTGGRQSRSSSLTVPVPPSNSQSPEPLHSPKSPLLEPSSGSPRGSRSSSLAVPVHTGSGTLPSTPTLTTSSPTPTSPTSPASPNMNVSPSDVSPNGLLLSPGVSKSASEPEREKEMFRFPKSSTDGALSSVLLVQESNLSSDDFHEALFLEKSPKSSKRRKKSKKDRNKENGMESMPKPPTTALSTPVAERRSSKEASSVL